MDNEMRTVTTGPWAGSGVGSPALVIDVFDQWENPPEARLSTCWCIVEDHRPTAA